MVFSMCGMFGLGSTDKNWSLKLNFMNRAVLLVLCAINALCVMSCGGSSYVVPVLLSIFAGCVLAAAVMDWWEQMVYRFVWWAAGASGVLLLMLKIFCMGDKSGCPDLRDSVYQLCLYIILQQFVFARFYGRADCHAFCVCAIVLTSMGQSFSSYLYHMTIVFLGLALVQLARGNVKLNGKLKEPVPLVPYIAAAFWVWVDFTAYR